MQKKGLIGRPITGLFYIYCCIVGEDFCYQTGRITESRTFLHCNNIWEFKPTNSAERAWVEASMN